jgi:glycosyltransferase involved in cell wall biosynthesis
MKTDKFYVLYPFVSGFGGIERLVLDLSAFLHAQGKSLVLIAFKNAVDFAEYDAGRLSVQTLHCRRNLYAEVLALRRYFHDNQISTSQILAMEMRGAMYAGMALPAGYNLHIADPPSLLPSDLTKYSFSLARKYPEQKIDCSLATRGRGQIIHWLTRRGIRKAGHAITMTQRNVEELHAAYGVKFEKVPPGVRIPDVVGRKPRSDGQIRFLSVCRLEPSKRIDAIIRSLADLVKDSQADSPGEMTLRIVGEGSQDQQLKDLAKDCGIESLVEFAGLVSDEELEKAYAESDIFVMPAKQGYGLPGLESLARSLQLIVHRESGVTEFLTNTPQVQIIDNFESSLTEAMRQAARMVHLPAGNRPSIPTSDEWASRIVELSGW